MSRKVAINTDWGGFDYTPEMKTWFLANTLGMDVNNPEALARHSSTLIQCIEACKDVGDIVVVEIDEDRYFIQDYDGRETLYTPSTCPWVYVE
jgi:hypothetical protein